MPPRLLVRLEVAQAAVEGGEPSAEAALESLFPNQWKLQGGQYRLGGHRVVHAAAADGAAAAAAALLEEPPAVRPAAAGRGVHIPFVVQPQGSPGQPTAQQALRSLREQLDGGELVCGLPAHDRCDGVGWHARVQFEVTGSGVRDRGPAQAVCPRQCF